MEQDNVSVEFPGYDFAHKINDIVAILLSIYPSKVIVSCVTFIPMFGMLRDPNPAILFM